MLLVLRRLAADSDEARAQGLWKLVSGRSNGKELPVAGVPGKAGAKEVSRILVVAGRLSILTTSGGFLVAMGDGPIELFRNAMVGEFELVPGKQPKEVNLKVSSSKQAVRTPGLYAMDGDTLRVCFPSPFEERKEDPIRPLVMAAEAGDGQILLSFERLGRQETQELVAQVHLQSALKRHKRGGEARWRALKGIIALYPKTKAAQEARQSVPPAIWIDTTGREIEAEYAGVISGEVRLRTADGETIKVPLERQSEENRKWIEGRRR